MISTSLLYHTAPMGQGHEAILTREVLIPVLRPGSSEREHPGAPDAADVVERLATRDDRQEAGTVEVAGAIEVTLHERASEHPGDCIERVTVVRLAAPLFEAQKHDREERLEFAEPVAPDFGFGAAILSTIQ
jgi:hypothetical protein